MFYKHWEKIALALTALFWAGCDDSGSSAVCLYGPDPNYSSEAITFESSSSEEVKSSSSIAEESSSSIRELLSSSSIAVVYGPMAVNCYNDTAVNDSGKVFDIIKCEDGKKYLHEPGLYDELPETQKELPEGVNINMPMPSNSYAGNCEISGDICYERAPDDSVMGGCRPIVNCPKKKDNE